MQDYATRIETDRHGFVLCVERIRDRALDKQKIIRLDRVLGLKDLSSHGN